MKKAIAFGVGLFIVMALLTVGTNMANNKTTGEQYYVSVTDSAAAADKGEASSSLTEKATSGTRFKVYKNGELIAQGENTWTNAGLDLIKAALGQGHKVIVNHLALGNTTAPTAASTAHPGIISTCGLTSADGTYWSEGTGNWTIGYTWTSTCNSVNVNTTGLYNDTNSGTYFSGGTFTAQTLNMNDQFTINYTRWILAG